MRRQDLKRCLLCHSLLTESPLLGDLFGFRQPKDSACQKCLAPFTLLSQTGCIRCYKEGSDAICSDCIAWETRGEIICHTSIYRYNDAMSDFFEAYKFQEDYLLKGVFQSVLKKYLKSYKDWTIVPVPVSQFRYDERGFSQVAAMLESAEIPYRNLLRKEERLHQVTLSRQERLQLAQPFSLREEALSHQYAKVLLVDDVYTTGATLIRARQALSPIVSEKIETFSLAR